jgi:hypothetical protein
VLCLEREDGIVLDFRLREQLDRKEYADNESYNKLHGGSFMSGNLSVEKSWLVCPIRNSSLTYYATSPKYNRYGAAFQLDSSI